MNTGQQGETGVVTDNTIEIGEILEIAWHGSTSAGSPIVKYEVVGKGRDGILYLRSFQTGYLIEINQNRINNVDWVRTGDKVVK